METHEAGGRPPRLVFELLQRPPRFWRPHGLPSIKYPPTPSNGIHETKNKNNSDINNNNSKNQSQNAYPIYESLYSGDHLFWGCLGCV